MVPQGSTALPSPAADVQDDFLALMCADDELLRAEFEEIVAAAWPSRPRPPGPNERVDGRPGPARSPGWTGRSEGPPGHQAVVVNRWVRERSPRRTDRTSVGPGRQHGGRDPRCTSRSTT